MTSVTILSTVYNIFPTVDRWLSALLNQDYDDYDILIIDSCSEDGTLSVINEYRKKSSKINLVVKKTKQPEAFNLAIDSKLLRGDLVAMIDGDCVAPKDWLKKLVTSLKDNNADAVGGPGFTPKDATKMQQIIGMNLDSRFSSSKAGQVLRHPNMNLLIKRHILEENRFEEALPVAYDTDYGYRLTSKGHVIWYEPTAFVYHYHRSTYSAYIHQQITTAKYALLLYARRPKALIGDNINPLFMILQPILLFTFLTFLFASIILPTFLIFVAAAFIGLLATLIAETVAAIVTLRDPRAILLLPLLVLRLFAWAIGGIEGIFNIVDKYRLERKITRS